MIYQDDRTLKQKKSHRWAVVARDKAMSGRGGARGGASRCAWACDDSVNIDRVERWVRSRSEMRHVNVVNLDTYRPPRGTAHFHVYVVTKDHPAANY